MQEKMRERGLKMEGAMERSEAVEMVLAADAGGATTRSADLQQAHYVHLGSIVDKHVLQFCGTPHGGGCC